MNFTKKKKKLENLNIDVIENYIYKLVKTIMVFILFFNIYLVQYIPIIIFKMPIQNIGTSMSIILNTFSSVVLLFVLFFIYRKELVKEWKIFKDKLADNLNYGIKYWFIGLLIMFAANLFINIVLHGGQSGNEQTVQSMIDTLPWLMLISAGFLAPFTEEIVFRKSLKDIIKNKYIYIAMSFFLFGLAHVVGNTNNLVDWLYIIPYGALGASFAVSYYKTKTIFTPIAMHMMHNTFLTIVSIFGM